MEKTPFSRLVDSGHGGRIDARDPLRRQAAGEYLVADGTQADDLVALIDRDLDQRATDGAGQRHLVFASSSTAEVRPTARPAIGLTLFRFFWAMPRLIARTLLRRMMPGMSSRSARLDMAVVLGPSG